MSLYPLNQTGAKWASTWHTSPDWQLEVSLHPHAACWETLFRPLEGTTCKDAIGIGERTSDLEARLLQGLGSPETIPQHLGFVSPSFN